MDWLRWILLLIGAVIVAAVWWAGYRYTRDRDESLFDRARRDTGDPDPEPGAGDTPRETPASADDPPDLDVTSVAPIPDDDSVPDIAVERDESGASTGRERPAPAGDGAARASPAGRGTGGAAQRRGESSGAAASATRPATGRTGERDGEEWVESVFVVAAGGERLVGSRLQALFANHGLHHGEMDIFHLYDPEGRIQFSVANLVEPGTFDPATMDTLSTPGVALFMQLPGPASAEIAFDRMIRTARALAEEFEGHLLDGQQSTLTRQTEQHLRDRMRDYDHRRRGRA